MTTTTLENGMIVTVRPRNTGNIIEGTIVKYQPCEYLANNGVVWIKAVNGDQYKFFEGFDEITVTPKHERLAVDFADWAQGQLLYAGKVGIYGDDDYSEVIVEGSKYNVSVSFMLDGRIELSTVHCDRFLDTNDIENASANCRTVKTMRAAKNYIERYI